VSVEAAELRVLLKQVRRARAGTLELNPAPQPIATYLGHGVGYLCDVLAAWFETTTTDRRAADAAIRFYGLGRMPESQGSIVETFPKRGGRSGISARRVQQLIDEAIDDNSHRSFRLTNNPASSLPKTLEDPFPVPLDCPDRLKRSRALLWAWADVTDTTGNDAEALLLYEYEHGLRAWSPRFPHPQDKQRARIRAFSMLDVANYRLSEAIPSDPIVDRILGPRQGAALELCLTDDCGDLMTFYQWPDLVDPHAAIDIVRDALASYRPESKELLGLLRDGILRLRHVPEDVRARVLSLSVLSSRHRRDPAGVVVADELLRHLGEVARTRSIGPEARARRSVVLTSTLRAAQEAAELSDQIGDMKMAEALFRAGHDALSEFGDPQQENEPDGWLQQFLFSEAAWLRTRARLKRDPKRSLRWAESTAAKSSDLVFGPGILPVPWGLAAEEQRIGAVLDCAEQELIAGDHDATARTVGRATKLVELQEANWRAVPGVDSRPEVPSQVRLGLLGTAQAAWRAALLVGDHDAIESSRVLTWERMGRWTPPALVATFRELDSWSQRQGMPPLVTPAELDSVSGLQDRGGRRTRLPESVTP
jgi:hypothetical protein